MQIEGAKLIFVMKFSVLHFFKFASNCTDVSLDFQHFPGRGLGGEGGMPLDHSRNVLSFVH